MRPMKMFDEHDFTRVEFDWLAHDEAGHIGFMSSAGAGPVPSASLADAARLENLLAQIQALPQTCEAQVAVDVVSYVEEWLTVARRGLYAFDWRRETSSYRTVASPSKPLSLASLKQPLRDLAERVRLKIIFERGTAFDASVVAIGPW